MKITKKKFIANRGCYSREHCDTLSFMRAEGSTFTLQEFLASEIPVYDKLFFLFKIKAIKPDVIRAVLGNDVEAYDYVMKAAGQVEGGDPVDYKVVKRFKIEGYEQRIIEAILGLNL